MEQETMRRFKRTQMILLLAAVILLFFGGCGRQEESSEGRATEPEILTSGEREEENVSAAGRRANAEGMVQEAILLTLSDEKVIVEYTGEIFMSSYRAMGADSIYLTGYWGEPAQASSSSDYFVGRMGIEDSEIQEFNLNLPEDMFALRACVDGQGNCHLLLTSKEDNKVTYEDMGILVINREGETVQQFDLSVFPGYEEMRTLWYWMVTDGSGNYYFGNPAKVLSFDTNTGKIWLYRPEDEAVEGLGIGKSGTVYGVFGKESKEVYLSEIHIEENTVVHCAKLPENSSRLSFNIAQPGVNTELLLADKGAGIWSYDGQEITLTMPIKDVIGSGQDILAMGFLADGRCCVMSYEDRNYRFYYVPAEE